MSEYFNIEDDRDMDGEPEQDDSIEELDPAMKRYESSLVRGKNILIGDEDCPF